MVPLDTESRLRQVRHDLAAYKEQILRKYPVNRKHQTNCGLIKANLGVRARGMVDLEQLKLPRQTELRGLSEDHLSAFRRAHGSSPCDQKSFLPANWPILA